MSLLSFRLAFDSWRFHLAGLWEFAFPLFSRPSSQRGLVGYVCVDIHVYACLESEFPFCLCGVGLVCEFLLVDDVLSWRKLCTSLGFVSVCLHFCFRVHVYGSRILSSVSLFFPSEDVAIRTLQICCDVECGRFVSCPLLSMR